MRGSEDVSAEVALREFVQLRTGNDDHEWDGQCVVVRGGSSLRWSDVCWLEAALSEWDSGSSL